MFTTRISIALLLFCGAVFAQTPVATDNFTRSNESPLSGGGNWTACVSGVAGINLTSNQATGAESASGCRMYNGASFSADQYAKITFAAVASGNYLGLSLRGDGAGNYYDVAADNGVAFIRKASSGSPSTLTSVSQVFIAGDILYLEVVGSSPAVLTLKLNGTTIGTYSDSSSPFTTGKPGLASYNNSATTTASFWEGGNIGGSSRRRNAGVF